ALSGRVGPRNEVAFVGGESASSKNSTMQARELNALETRCRQMGGNCSLTSARLKNSVRILDFCPCDSILSESLGRLVKLKSCLIRQTPGR
ncbi:hypothetical protein NO135_22065, partial [Clostridioides difficile]|nr:hypothetical protein [Clostridioides difficile]